jgi:hypothetical protein
MRRNWIAGALLPVAIASPSSAQTQISVYIGTPPPAIVYEEPGPPPAAEFVWIAGYWKPVGHHYKWVRGHWERPPLEGACWTHPHYDHYHEGWEWHDGYWSREDHDNGHWREHDPGRGHHDHEGHEHEDRD